MVEEPTDRGGGVGPPTSCVPSRHLLLLLRRYAAKAAQVRTTESRYRGVTRTAHGEKYVVPAVEFHECPDCGEKLYGRQAMHKLESFRPKMKAVI